MGGRIARGEVADALLPGLETVVDVRQVPRKLSAKLPSASVGDRH